MVTRTRTYYISAGSNDITADIQRHLQLEIDLYRLGGSMIDCLGTYHGMPILSWLFNTADPTVESDVLDLARKYRQESILIVHGDNQDAELVFTDGSRKIIGKMVCLGPDEGQLRGRDYSFVNGNYYVVE